MTKTEMKYKAQEILFRKLCNSIGYEFEHCSPDWMTEEEDYSTAPCSCHDLTEKERDEVFEKMKEQMLRIGNMFHYDIETTSDIPIG